MSDLEIFDLAGLRTLLLVLGIAVVEAEIVVIRGDGAEDVATPAPEQEGYFLAAIRFFFLAGSLGRDLPNEPW